MSASDWTLESELCKLARVDSLGRALVELGLLSSDSEGFRLVPRTAEWERGGAETYIYRFAVSGVRRHVVECLLKACVAYKPGGSIQQILEGWVNRWQLLAESGATVPHVFRHGNGVILEEYIPYEVRSRLFTPTDDNLPLLRQMALTGGIIARLGFLPVRFFGNLRSRGSDVVVIDFGEDLGEPGQGDAGVQVLDELHRQLVAWDVEVPDGVTAVLARVFEQGYRPSGPKGMSPLDPANENAVSE